MRSVIAGILALFVMASSAGAVEFGTASKGREFNDVRAGVNKQVRDLNKDTSGSRIRWTGILVHCECAKKKGEIAYAYDIVSGTVSAISLTGSLKDYMAQQNDSCSTKPKMAALTGAVKKTAVRKTADDFDRFYQGPGYTAYTGRKAYRRPARPLLPRRRF